MKIILKKINISILSIIGKWILNFLYKTNKWDIRGEKNYLTQLRNKKSVIISVWHGHLLAPFMHLSNNNFYGLAGTHRDAEILSKISKKLGWRPLRGSSSDGGSEIFKDIVKILKIPETLFALTPDGPKGPEKIPKAGIIRAAQKTRAVIIPVAVYSTKNWQFVNWHTFFLEKPFGKIFVLYGEPISFNENDNYETCKQILIKAMSKTEEKNFNYAKQKTI